MVYSQVNADVEERRNEREELGSYASNKLSMGAYAVVAPNI
jgi:hypothetical protein